LVLLLPGKLQLFNNFSYNILFLIRLFLQKTANAFEIPGSEYPEAPAILTGPLTGKRCPRKKGFGEIEALIAVTPEADLLEKKQWDKLQTPTLPKGLEPE